MKAKLGHDWSPISNGTINLLTEDGKQLASLRIGAVNPQVVDLVNTDFHVVFRQIAEQLVETVNRPSSLELNMKLIALEREKQEAIAEGTRRGNFIESLAITAIDEQDYGEAENMLREATGRSTNATT